MYVCVRVSMNVFLCVNLCVGECVCVFVMMFMCVRVFVRDASALKVHAFVHVYAESGGSTDLSKIVIRTCHNTILTANTRNHSTVSGCLRGCVCVCVCVCVCECSCWLMTG